MRGEARQPAAEIEIWSEVEYALGPRLQMVRRHCHNGSELHLRWDPNDENDPDAVMVGVIRKRLFKTQAVQIGCLPDEDGEEVKRYLSRGWNFKAWVHQVKWTEDDRVWVNINILLSPPSAPEVPTRPAPTDPKSKPPKPKPADVGLELDETAAPPPPPPRPRFRPRIEIVLPETWLKRATVAATVLVAEGAGLIAIGVAVSPLLGRLSDILGLGVVAAAVGGGMWGMLLVARVK